MPFNTVVRMIVVLCLMLQVAAPLHACERMAAPDAIQDAMMQATADQACHRHGVPAPDSDSETDLGACCGKCLIHLQLFGGVSSTSATLEASVALWRHPGVQLPPHAYSESPFKPPRPSIIS